MIAQDDHMNEIEPYLYLGSVDAIYENTYQTFDVRKVISVLSSEREMDEVKKHLSNCPYKIDHTCILLKDNGTDPVNDYFTLISQEIKDAVDNKIPTLVHCFAGVSRSATLVAAYLCATRDYNYDQAYKFLQTKRSAVYPTFGFIVKLANAFPKK